MKGFGQGSAEFVDAFQRIVEGDNRAVARVLFYIIDHIISREPLGIVAGHEVPHHDLVFPAQPSILAQTHPTMRRTEVMAVDIGIGLLDIIAILLNGMSQSANMVMRVIANLV